MTIYYFGYGSNMSTSIMKTWCGNGFQMVSVAHLDGFRLAFNRKSVRWGGGAADIVPDRNQAVWGIVYDIDAGCRLALDEKEGLDVAYERMTCEVTLTDGTSMTVMTYTVIDKQDPELAPAPAYLDIIQIGAREHNLPEDYQKWLATIQPAVSSSAINDGQ